jgi:hypothetical protein
MPTLEMPPAVHASAVETTLPPERAYAEVAGRAAVAGAEVQLPNNGELEEGTIALYSLVYNIDVRPEDAGRLHVPQVAHEAALEMTDPGRVHDIEAAYAAANQENEIFNAYTEAQAEDQARTEAKLEQERAVAEEAAYAEKEAREAAAEVSNQPATATSAEVLKNAPVEKRAAAALKDAGISSEVVPGTASEDASGVLTIVQGGEVKVLEPQAGGKYNLTTYNVDAEHGTVVMNKPNALIPSKRKLVASNTVEDRRLPAITLPPAVAKVAGFKEAVAVS